MFIIAQSGQWAVNTDQVVVIRQMPHDNNKSTAICAEVSNNEFILATYVDKDYANKVFNELLSSVVISGRDTYQLPEERDKCDT